MTPSPLEVAFVAMVGVGAVVAGVGASVGWNREGPGASEYAVFLVLLGATALAGGAYGLGALVRPLPGVGGGLRPVWYDMVYALVVLLVIPWVLFTVRYTGRSRDLALTARREAVFSLPVVATPVLLWGTVVLEEWLGWTVSMPAETAVEAVVVLLGFYAFTLNFGAVAFLVYAAYVYDHLPTAQGVSLGVTAAAPFPFLLIAGSVLTGSSVPDWVGASSMAVGFGLCAAGAGLGVFRYDAFRSTPAAGNVGRETLIEEMDDLVLVVDGNGEVAESNPAASDALGGTAGATDPARDPGSTARAPGSPAGTGATGNPGVGGEAGLASSEGEPGAAVDGAGEGSVASTAGSPGADGPDDDGTAANGVDPGGGAGANGDGAGGGTPAGDVDGRDGTAADSTPGAGSGGGLAGRDVSRLLGMGVEELRAVESVELATASGRRRFDPGIVPLEDRHGREYGHLVTLRDVTRREIREQRLEVLNRVLRHNLRNKLSIVKGTADSIAAGREPPEEAADRLGRAAEDLMELGEKAREIERLMRGEGPEGIPVAVETVVEEVVGDVAHAHPEGEFETSVPEDCYVEAGEGLLRYLLENLVENAVEHNDAPEPWVGVTVEWVGPEREALGVTVADDGPGIPEHELAAIRDSEETPLVHGSGIGLWAANWCATRLGGDLAFERAGGDGTTVRIELPPTAPFRATPGEEDPEAVPAELD